MINNYRNESKYSNGSKFENKYKYGSGAVSYYNAIEPIEKKYPEVDEQPQDMDYKFKTPNVQSYNYDDLMPGNPVYPPIKRHYPTIEDNPIKQSQQQMYQQAAPVPAPEPMYQQRQSFYQQELQPVCPNNECIGEQEVLVDPQPVKTCASCMYESAQELDPGSSNIGTFTIDCDGEYYNVYYSPTELMSTITVINNGQFPFVVFVNGVEQIVLCPSESWTSGRRKISLFTVKCLTYYKDKVDKYGYSCCGSTCGCCKTKSCTGTYCIK